MRTRLPNRRPSLTEKIEFLNVDYFITVSVDAEEQIKEVFCANPMIVGSDIHGLMVAGCILISRLLQRGEELEELDRAMPENRNEGETSGPPTNVLGAIIRKALQMQLDLNGNQMLLEFNEEKK